MPLQLNDAWMRILSQPGKIFSVKFRKRYGAQAGTIRDMLCMRPVYKYATGVVPPAERFVEDWNNDVLTVWDLQKFRELRAQGVPEDQAGYDSYRKINMREILDISIPP
jgi:hypothetical protein